MLRVTKIENNSAQLMEGWVNFLLDLCVVPNLCAISLGDAVLGQQGAPNCSFAVRNENWGARLDLSGLFGSKVCSVSDPYLVQAMTKIAANNRGGPGVKLCLEHPQFVSETSPISRFAVINRVSGEFLGEVGFCQQGSQILDEANDYAGSVRTTEKVMLGAIDLCHRVSALSQDAS